MSDHDRIYSGQGPAHLPGRFSFDEKVVQVFPDMIRRSVPGYSQMLAMTAQIARMQANQLGRALVVYDLGCSTGAVGQALLQVLGEHELKLIAIDNSAPMIEQAKAQFAGTSSDCVRCVLADITEVEFEPCDLVISNLTLQFVDPSERLGLLKRIHGSLELGGQLIVSDKISAGSADPWLIDVHEQFKRANGYSETEIARKREALEGVLIRDSLSDHHQRFASAGFAESHTWFQYLNFVALCAIKSSDAQRVSDWQAGRPAALKSSP